MKILRKSNYDHEDHRGDQHFVEIVRRGNDGSAPMPLRPCDAEALAKCLNCIAGERSDDYYLAVSDDYVLPPDWKP